MGLSWKWSISEVFLQNIVGGVGALYSGKYGAQNSYQDSLHTLRFHESCKYVFVTDVART